MRRHYLLCLFVYALAIVACLVVVAVLTVFQLGLHVHLGVVSLLSFLGATEDGESSAHNIMLHKGYWVRYTGLYKLMKFSYV